MLVIRGAGSRIAQELIELYAEPYYEMQRGEAAPTDATHYVFCQGLLRPSSIEEHTDETIAESFLVNTAHIMRECEYVLKANARARICVVGSESGYAWSYDDVYAASKAALHKYVETRRMKSPRQQLVAVAPGIIADAGMTLRRTDKARLKVRAAAHPKGRFLTSKEVAKAIYFLLFEDRGYINNHVLRMNGGEHLAL